MVKAILIFSLVLGNLFSVHAGVVVLNGLTHQFKTEKNEVYRGSIEIQNNDDFQQSVKIYLQDISYNFTGTTRYSSPSSKEWSNADWITLSTDLIVLKPKERQEISFEIIVPADVERHGSYHSAIIVEPVDNLEPQQSKMGIQINSVVRYAVQIISDYATQNVKSDIKFVKFDYLQQEGKKLFKIALENTGVLFSKGIASIELFDRKSGEKIGPIASQVMGLLPKNSKTFIIDLTAISAGSYKATVFFTDQYENVFAVNIDLEV